ncbi:MAG: diadenylate cyclase, partial [Candidatus ainarchaeum sp.]|nr:diadenylate cyclase [Candidatus ainarchaeum sp.]
MVQKIKNDFNKKTISLVTALVNEMANQKKGSFFIITKQNISNKYERLYPDLFSHKKINLKEKETQTLLIALAELDGAIIVDNEGYVLDYGVKIKKTKILLGHGTRHSAARGISKEKGVLPIISSEEDGRVRIFKEGEMVAEINPRTGKDKLFFEKIGELFSRPD